MNDPTAPVSCHDQHLQNAPAAVGPDAHDGLAFLEDPERVAIGMQDVLIVDSVSASTARDLQGHETNLTRI